MSKFPYSKLVTFPQLFCIKVNCTIRVYVLTFRFVVFWKKNWWKTCFCNVWLNWLQKEISSLEQNDELLKPSQMEQLEREVGKLNLIFRQIQSMPRKPGMISQEGLNAVLQGRKFTNTMYTACQGLCPSWAHTCTCSSMCMPVFTPAQA